MIKILDKLYHNSRIININDKSKYVIMSDCHRGNGDNYDDFLKNQNIFRAALNYYYQNGFTYIELGDGDELWEVKKYDEIINAHLDVFKLLKKYFDEGRLIMIYGNHDIVKEDCSVLEKYFYTYYDEDSKEKKALLNGFIVEESLVLKYKGNNIFLLHGHQVDLISGTFWKMSRFLVRYIWRPLTNVGVNDLTSAAKNNQVSKYVEKKLQNWSKKNNTIVISGHTHRPIFPKNGDSLYFNDGSCIHPNGITCLEVDNGCICLVRWELSVNNQGIIYSERKVLAGKEKIDLFWKTNNM